MKTFSWQRFLAILTKEFTQMQRDRLTFAMIALLPLIQLILFGYAININPRHLPTAVISADHSTFTRTFIRGLENTRYFNVTQANISEKKAEQLMRQGQVVFIVNIPANFTHDVIKGLKPTLLVTADATDPSASGNALNALHTLASTILTHDLKQGLSHLIPDDDPFKLVMHRRYNPESITQHNIVPGLIGVVLSMTMIMITALAITRERERGTMENLLATPAGPLEVMLGIIVPYVLVGYIQLLLIILFGLTLFHIPFEGNFLLLCVASLPFILANLSVALTFSTIAKNQLQAVQMTFFFFLPSLLLSGFMFPFKGMPHWAQVIGNCLPLTHYHLIVRGIMLKGNGLSTIWPELIPILLFVFVVLGIGLMRYRRTLD